MAKFTTIESRREELRQKRKDHNEFHVTAKVAGKEKEIPVTMLAGEIEELQFTQPIGEMLTSSDISEGFLKKAVVDVELGREDVPLLYKSIYRTKENKDYPKKFDPVHAQRGRVVFLERMELEEVKFGDFDAETKGSVELKNFAAGFEYTNEMEIFNEMDVLEEMQRSMGQAYNALLNHLHLSPIINFAYTAANKTAADGDANKSIALKNTLRNAVQATILAKRPGTILLANELDRFKIEDAMQTEIIDSNTVHGVSGISEVIFYNGWEETVGKKSYSYPGVPQGKAYLIRPKKSLLEYIKQDMQIDVGNADVSRLVEAQIVGHAWRGIYAAIEENVQEITLP